MLGCMSARDINVLTIKTSGDYFTGVLTFNLISKDDTTVEPSQFNQLYYFQMTLKGKEKTGIY